MNQRLAAEDVAAPVSPNNDTIADAVLGRIDMRTADDADPHPKAVMARYDHRAGRVVIGLSRGLEISFKPLEAPGLQDVSSEQLGDIEISPSGQCLHSPLIDADLYLPALLKTLSREN